MRKRKRENYIKVFQKDPEKLERMLRMREEGYSAAELGRIFGVDHTSILHQCRKYKTKPFKKKIAYKPEKIKSWIRSREPILKREGINLGKDLYEDYLKENQDKEFIRDKKGNIIRIKCVDNLFDSSRGK